MQTQNKTPASVEFVYLPEMKPLDADKRRDFFTFDILNNGFLKKKSDVVSPSLPSMEKKHNVDRIDDIISSGEFTGQKTVEVYRKIWKNMDLDMYFKGYGWYLYVAYMSDMGIEVSPWYFWNVIVHQFAQVVKDNAEEYRHLFTKCDDKIEIGLQSDEFDVSLFTEKIREMIPDTKVYDMFFPSWDKAVLPESYQQSLEGLFADMVQKYYGCFIFGCSLPKVRVLGEQNDWDILADSVSKLAEVFNHDYLKRVSVYVDGLRTKWNKSETWEKFFYIDNCGSGHQESVKGSFRELLNIGLNSEFLTNQIPSTLSRFPFKDLCRNKDCFFLAGMIGGTMDKDGYLVPVYDTAITELSTDLSKLNEDEMKFIVDMREKVSKLEQLTIEYLPNHVPIRDNYVNMFKIMHDETREIYEKGGESRDKLYVDNLEHMKRRYKQQLENIKTMKEEGYHSLDPRGWQKEEPTYEISVKYIDELYANGTKNDYKNKLEEMRMLKPRCVWKKHDMNMSYGVGGSFFHVSLDDYNKNVEDAKKLYEFMLDETEMRKFIEDMKVVSEWVWINNSIKTYIIYTFDLDVWKLYLKISGVDDKRSFFKTLIQDFKLIVSDDGKDVNAGSKKVVSGLHEYLNEKIFTTLKDEVKEYITYMLGQLNDDLRDTMENYEIENMKKIEMTGDGEPDYFGYGVKYGNYKHGILHSRIGMLEKEKSKYMNMEEKYC